MDRSLRDSANFAHLVSALRVKESLEIQQQLNIPINSGLPETAIYVDDDLAPIKYNLWP